MAATTIDPSKLRDRSGTVTTGGQAQQLLALDSARRGWRIQNNSDGDIWFNDTGSAAAVKGAGSYKLSSGDYYESATGSQPAYAVSIFGATTGQAFSAGEW